MGPFYEGWEHFSFDKVHWSMAKHELVSWLAMVIVVAFSSSLDVAAIEMEVSWAGVRVRL